MSFFFVSCNDVIEENTKSNKQITLSVDNFISDSSSRTITDSNKGYKITWAADDVIGIFPYEGYQEPFTIPTEQIGESKAIVDGGYWALKDGYTYNAYYPFDVANFESAEMKTTIPVSYIGQWQNGNSCNIGSFDYTYSDWTTASDGEVHFQFHHIGAIMVFHLEYPATTNYTQFTIKTDEDIIPTTGTYDLTANLKGEKVEFKANEDSYQNSISMTLNEHSGIAGEIGHFYMMLPPIDDDLSEKNFTITLTSESGTEYSYLLERPYTKIVASNKYERNLQRAPFTLLEGWLFPVIIEYELSDETTKIKFVTNSEQTSSSFIESNDGNGVVAYSINNGETFEIHTSADKFVVNEDCTAMFNWGDGNELNLTEIDFEDNVDFTPATTMEFMFATMTSLSTLDLSSFNTTNVANMYSMFAGCSSLTNLNLSSFNTENVTDMCAMFDGCNSLTTLNLTNFNTENVTDMCAMFYDCSNLTELDLRNFVFNEGTDFTNMFQGVGENAENRPISIFVTEEGKTILEQAETGINESYAKFVVVE